MEMTGEQLIGQPQQKVWEALNDPEVLKACIPGCETIEKVTDTEYKMTMVAAVGPVKAKFNGKLMLGDMNPPNSYNLAFEGSGGAAGFGKGNAAVSLAPEGSSTKLTYTAKAQIGGKLAQVGARLIDGVAKKMADDFFKAFTAHLGTAAPAAAVEAASTSAAPAADTAAPPVSVTTPAVPAKSGFSPFWIVVTIVAIIVVLALLFKR